MTFVAHRLSIAAFAATAIAIAAINPASAQGSAVQATVGEANPKTPEVSTADVRRILTDGSAMLVDAGGLSAASSFDIGDRVGNVCTG